MNDRTRDGLHYDRPATYKIRVCGKIPATWQDRLEGMAIIMDESEGGGRVTTLQGELRDQASLTGVINALFELHLPILSVECMSN